MPADGCSNVDMRTDSIDQPAAVSIYTRQLKVINGFHFDSLDVRVQDKNCRRQRRDVMTVAPRLAERCRYIWDRAVTLAAAAAAAAVG